MKMILKKTQIHFLLLLIGAGCTRYNVRVNSFSAPGAEMPSKPSLNFASPKEPDLKLQRITANCMEGAARAGFKTHLNATDCADCVHVVVSGSMGGTQTGTYSTTGSEYNWQSGQYQNVAKVHSYRRHRRIMDVKIFADSDLQQLIHQLDLNSLGKTDSILKTAKYICEAGFRIFPQEAEGKRVTVWP